METGLKAYKGYSWIVKDAELLGGRLALRGSRISVSLFLECLAAGMTLEAINDEYGTVFTQEAVKEVHQVAAELLGNPDVAA